MEEKSKSVRTRDWPGSNVNKLNNIQEKNNINWTATKESPMNFQEWDGDSYYFKPDSKGSNYLSLSSPGNCHQPTASWFCSLIERLEWVWRVVNPNIVHLAGKLVCLFASQPTQLASQWIGHWTKGRVTSVIQFSQLNDVSRPRAKDSLIGWANISYRDLVDDKQIPSSQPPPPRRW